MEMLKRTQLWRQTQVLPVGNAMSDTWQWVELWEKILQLKIFGVNKKIRSSKGELKLPNIIEAAKAMGYDENTTMYEILFANDKAKSYKADQKDEIQAGYDNTEAFGDSRNVLGSDGKPWKGYGFFIQKYLFEEYADFGRDMDTI